MISSSTGAGDGTCTGAGNSSERWRPINQDGQLSTRDYHGLLLTSFGIPQKAADDCVMFSFAKSGMGPYSPAVVFDPAGEAGYTGHNGGG